MSNMAVAAQQLAITGALSKDIAQVLKLSDEERAAVEAIQAFMRRAPNDFGKLKVLLSSNERWDG
jgi:hypothetical protein